MKRIDEEEFELFINDIEGNDAQEIRTLIMEQASDTAEKLTELDCTVNNIICYITKMEFGTQHITFTEEAQDMFNVYYDNQTDELYRLLYRQMKLIEK